MAEKPRTTKDTNESAETIELLAQVFQDWKRTHPDGTWRTFWAAVGAGEVEMPQG